MIQTQTPPLVLLEGEVAELLNVSVHTLRGWRQKKLGPPYAKVGGLVRYRRAEVEKWLDAQTRRN